jgi:hypothetical protein
VTDEGYFRTSDLMPDMMAMISPSLELSVYEGTNERLPENIPIVIDPPLIPVAMAYTYEDVKSDVNLDILATFLSDFRTFKQRAPCSPTVSAGSWFY